MCKINPNGLPQSIFNPIFVSSYSFIYLSVLFTKRQGLFCTIFTCNPNEYVIQKIAQTPKCWIYLPESLNNNWRRGPTECLICWLHTALKGAVAANTAAYL